MSPAKKDSANMGETSGATSMLHACMPQEVSDAVTSESWDLLVLLPILRVPVSASDRGWSGTSSYATTTSASSDSSQ